MKGTILTVACVLLAGIANANLVVNGSFEEGTVGELNLPSIDQVTGWRAFDTSKSNSVELVNDASEASDGSNYIKITSVLSGAGLGDTGFDITSYGAGKVLLSTGVTYTVSFDAKWVSGTDNSLNFQVKTQKEGTPQIFEDGLLSVNSIVLNSSWTTYTYEFTPTTMPDDGKGITLYVGFRPKAGGTLQDEVIYLDNVQVVPEPASVSLLAAASCAVLLLRKMFAL